MQLQTTIPTRYTLEATPLRAAQFLMTLGTKKPIRRALARRGYTAEVHAQGWANVHAASGYTTSMEHGGPALASAPPGDTAAAQAAVDLDALDGQILQLSRAALQWNHPEVAQLLLADLEPATGVKAVLNVKTWLERLDELERAEGLAPQIVARNTAALQTLAARGYTRQERERLRGLVQQVEALGELEEDDDATADARIHEARLTLYRWYKEWAEIARVEIARRDWLISLGLARRKKSGNLEVIEDVNLDAPEPELPEA